MKTLAIFINVFFVLNRIRYVMDEHSIYILVFLRRLSLVVLQYIMCYWTHDKTIFPLEAISRMIAGKYPKIHSVHFEHKLPKFLPQKRASKQVYAQTKQTDSDRGI